MTGCDIIHKWRPNGRSGMHLEREVFYVRCVECGQIGFRRAHFSVVYTWMRCTDGPSP